MRTAGDNRYECKYSLYRAVVTAGPVRTLRLLFQLASDGITAGVQLLALLERAAVALLVVLNHAVAAVPLQLQLRNDN